MRRRARSRVPASVATAGALLVGAAQACGSDPEPADGSCPAESCPFDAAGWSPDPTVSFQADVLPLLRRSCGLSSSCHGSPTKSAADLYLGPKLEDPTPIDAAVRQAILDGLHAPSKTAPSLLLAEPGSPTTSFLMLKLDGCHTAAGLACTPQPGADSDEPCGDRMPQGSGSLCAEERNLVRSWIALGTLDD